ncbi:MAG: hypothetical protein MHM6MM_006449 [Cercozoa sp. M6MM]
MPENASRSRVAENSDCELEGEAGFEKRTLDTQTDTYTFVTEDNVIAGMPEFPKGALSIHLPNKGEELGAISIEERREMSVTTELKSHGTNQFAQNVLLSLAPDLFPGRTGLAAILFNGPQLVLKASRLRVALATLCLTLPLALKWVCDSVWHGHLVFLWFVMTSLGTAMGEITCLSYSGLYTKRHTNSYTSGMGVAGLLGAAYSAFAMHSGINPSVGMLLVAWVPLFFAVAWSLLPGLPSDVKECVSVVSDQDIDAIGSDGEVVVVDLEGPSSGHANVRRSYTVLEKVRITLSLWQYTIPLLVCYLVYSFNKFGLSAVLSRQFKQDGLKAMYQWCALIERLCVSVSRASVLLYVMPTVLPLPILQIACVSMCALAVFLTPLRTIWVALLLHGCVGTLHGAIYSNAFALMKKRTAADGRRAEAALGLASIFATIGYLTGPILALVAEAALARAVELHDE